MEWSRREPIIHLQQLESFEPCCHQHVLRSLRDFWLAGPVTRMSCNSKRLSILYQSDSNLSLRTRNSPTKLFKYAEFVHPLKYDMPKELRGSS